MFRDDESNRRAWRIGICVLLAALMPALPAEGADKERKPLGRHARKWVFIDSTKEWRESIPPVPGTEDGDLDIAREKLAMGRTKEARKLLKKWLDAYPDSMRVPEAQFLRADADFELKNFMKAYKSFERIVGTELGTEWSDRALERELVIAEVFLSGRRQKVLGGLLRLPAHEEALDMLGRIRERKPGSRLSEKALRVQADYHFKKGEFAEAEDAYAMLSQDFPRGRHHGNAMFHSAESALADFHGIRFDDSALVEARERLLEYQRGYPDKADRKGVANYLDTIRSKRSAKELATGKWYLKVGKPGAAVFYFRSVMHNWPETTSAGQARVELEKMGREVPGASGP